MATWILAGNRKVNLDAAQSISRSENGDVLLDFGSSVFPFNGDAAARVWELVNAKDVGWAPSKVTPGGTQVIHRER